MFPFVCAGEFGSGVHYSKFAYAGLGLGGMSSGVSNQTINLANTGVATLPKQVNRVVIVGLRYSISAGTPAAAVTINGVIATKIIDNGIDYATVGFYLALYAARVGLADDANADNGYDITITDPNASDGSCLLSVWNVIMPSVVAHSTAHQLQGSSSTTLVMPSVTIPANGFSVLLVMGLGASSFTVDSGYPATPDQVTTGVEKVAAFSGAVTITWNTTPFLGSGIVASWAGDGT